MNKIQNNYLNNYLNTLEPIQRRLHENVPADYFCADEVNANICAQLIRNGEKTASCGMKYWYESGLEPLPKVGTLHVVTDWNSKPQAIIELLTVTECKFSEVTAEFAAQEGEGDKTLEWWRKAHWEFFSLECQEQGIEPSDDMLLVLETFKVVYL